MKKINVAIADDNQELVRRIEEYFINHAQINIVATASNGKLCLDMLEENDVDLLLLDIIMPHLDGIAVLEKIHMMDKYKDLSIMMLTAFGQEDIMKHVLNLGATYLILKPFDFEQLETKILTWTGYTTTGALPQKNSLHTEQVSISPLEHEISEILKAVGIPMHIRGYKHLCYAVALVCETPSLLNGVVTKVLYPEIAVYCDSTPTRVERSIRHAIEVAWSRQAEEFCRVLMGKELDETCIKPKNSVFIALVADKAQQKIAQS